MLFPPHFLGKRKRRRAPLQSECWGACWQAATWAGLTMSV